MGGFYQHFGSRDDLVAEAVSAASALGSVKMKLPHPAGRRKN